MMVVAVMVVPLPSQLLDLLLAINIGGAVLLLLSSMLTRRALDVSAFPSLLLIATLFRLALNVSSTRLILGKGDAGSIIASFGSFVIGGSVVVGLVVFLILVVIQFVVITNGATRVAEVGARFTLDAMPGKQMAIDADLNAGTIDENEARRRRTEIAAEADFYGAMDGASKFVKGDAIAGVLITVINLVGGLIIGIGQQGLAVGDAAATYSLLTVGDGLVSQIPALLISIASGIIVTRSAAEGDLGADVVHQFLQNRRVFRLGGIALGLLALVPGIPILPFAIISIILLVGSARPEPLEDAEEGPPDEIEIDPDDPAQLASDMRPEPLSLEVAADLVALVDPDRGGDLLDRVRGLRRKVALELGLIVPPVRTRDNLELPPGTYAILIHGVEMARGEAPAGKVLAIADDLGPLPGIETIEPVFGLPAKWLPAEHRHVAEAVGATLVDPSAVITTHLAELVRHHAAALLSRQEVKELMEMVRSTDPAVIEELTSTEVSVAEIQRVLQDLLIERVSIRDLVRILEVVSERARTSRDPEHLVEAVRAALGPWISSANASDEGVLPVITLDPAIEHQLSSSLVMGSEGTMIAIDPTVADLLSRRIADQVRVVEQTGQSPVLVCSPAVRRPLTRLLAASPAAPPIMSFNELGPQMRIEALGTVNVDAAA
ncbi:MAG: flagellar biosynthesis protein FlhA [Actinomycetia bacterium]|nr:flagellar biosynthesis protein FlhA [Actinomycetes bacterium]MCP4085654.1 flagellar biosynthesis protein FlhA [Actinomycetes bacterium]